MKKSTKILIVTFLLSLTLSIFVDWKEIQSGMSSFGGVYNTQIRDFAENTWRWGVSVSGDYGVMKKMTGVFPVSEDSVEVEKDKAGAGIVMVVFLMLFFGLTAWIIQRKEWEWMIVIIPVFFLLALPFCFFLMIMVIYHSSKLFWMVSFIMKWHMPSAVLFFYCLRTFRIYLQERPLAVMTRGFKRFVTH